MKNAVYIAIAAVLLLLMITLGTYQFKGDYGSGLTLSSELVPEGGTLSLNEPSDSVVPPDFLKMKPIQPRQPYIVIDCYCNKLYLRTADSVLLEADCSTGSGAGLYDTVSGRNWQFHTPKGVFTVHTKLPNPWWRKPDWAFVEEGIPIPRVESERLDNNMMGDYAIGFGDGYFIHGTIYERLLGIAVTHGCVRLSADKLRELYHRIGIGTRIYVY